MCKNEIRLILSLLTNRDLNTPFYFRYRPTDVDEDMVENLQL